MKVLFIINPKSGTNARGTLEQLIAEQAALDDFTYVIHKMRSRDEEWAILQDIDACSPDIIACAGGDGTVNLLARLLNGKSIPLAIIPTGSANGMARELRIENINTALKTLIHGRKKKIDLLSINGKICVHLADVGLNARIVKRFEHGTSRGLFTYARHLFSEVFLLRKYTFYITHDLQEVTFRAVSLTFANASKYGTGAVINPTGKLDDGKFELVIVKPFPQRKLLSIVWKMFNGTLDTSEYVRVISCEKALIYSNRRTVLQVDGEVIGKTKHIRIEMIHQALTVIMPEQLKG
ncbi:diacylglycerol/lipid kinase family protein [Hufsiella ginkgonis]|uniref:Diacylglycerol kinase n=1 Tax=Hufsiella ginkgonis TaxID=2695274 RepID=A0A7K1XXH4_9SPHI|nr:diacylglycerol kinase family protein [Hufsiella ginkgonis]MXV15528.1 diacylglycerol kinase [Hufsiella ginkgonis]